jgi:hypothetical protein
MMFEKKKCTCTLTQDGECEAFDVLPTAEAGGFSIG